MGGAGIMSIISKNPVFQLKRPNPAASHEASVTDAASDAARFGHIN